VTRLPIDRILSARGLRAPAGTVIGRSRRGRPLLGFRFGRGDRAVSLIGGAHADEPVGPEMLRRLVGFLGGLPPTDPLLAQWSWHVVPHINPDGAAVNAGWASSTLPVLDHRGDPDRGYRFSSYFESAVREAPGDDLEFGFPRGMETEDDRGARPEALAVAAFLRAGAPFVLHGSFHSMAFGAGPWFLLEPAWIDRTARLRDRLRAHVRGLGYRLHDVDRQGEKGFRRIDEGFCTRPDSGAMRRYFLDRDEPTMAARFRPSSMEFVRSLGGDPLTLVSEMPLFLVPVTTQPGGSEGFGEERPPLPMDLSSRRRFSAWALRVHREQGPETLDRSVAQLGIRAMALRDQMALQLAYLDEALAAVAAD